MPLDLSSYRAVRTANYVRLAIPGSGLPVFRFSDDLQTRTIAGESYPNIRQLLYISDTRSELRALEQEITVGIADLSSVNVNIFLAYSPKGGFIDIRQAFYNPTTNVLLPIAGNPVIKFRGIVTNFSLEEQWDTQAREQRYTAILQCSSLVSTITNKVTGRRTNDSDQQRLYPGDLSMTRVSTVTNAQFQFGKAGAPAP